MSALLRMSAYAAIVFMLALSAAGCVVWLAMQWPYQWLPVATLISATLAVCLAAAWCDKGEER